MRKGSQDGDDRGIDDALISRVRNQTWVHRFPRGWPLLLFVIGCLCTAACVVAIERAERLTRSIELDRNATEIASGLQRRASENVALLRAGAMLLSAGQDIKPGQFQTFARGFFGADGDYRGAIGIGWAPLLDAGEAATLETAMQARGVRNYTVYPAPDAGRIVPVIEVIPAERFPGSALGFDMYSEPVRRAAMEQALRRNHPVASGRLRLLPNNAGPGALGFIIYMPIRQPRDGRRVASGFVFSPFRAQDFLESAAELYRSRNVEIAVYDGEPGPDNLLALRAAPGEAGRSLDRQVTIADRTWVLQVRAKYTGSLSLLSRVTLFFGLIVSLLMMYSARLITRGALDDREVLESLSRQAKIRTQLTRELNHRVKNTLANVLSIVALTRRRGGSTDDFAESLTARLRALSATHDLLSQSDWTTASIGAIVRSELAPYIEEEGGQIAIDGPPISLAPSDALTLGLAIHELATNAAKYGALSTPDGRVTVSWRLVEPALAEVHWRERGGPTVVATPKRGFGRDLIEKIVAHELRSDVELSFDPDGVECRLIVPVRRITAFEVRQDVGDGRPPSPGGSVERPA